MVAPTCSIASGDPVAVTWGRAALTATAKSRGSSPHSFPLGMQDAAHPASPPPTLPCLHSWARGHPESPWVGAQRGAVSRALSTHCNGQVVRTTRIPLLSLSLVRLNVQLYVRSVRSVDMKEEPGVTHASENARLLSQVYASLSLSFLLCKRRE